MIVYVESVGPNKSKLHFGPAFAVEAQHSADHFKVLQTWLDEKKQQSPLPKRLQASETR